MNEISTKGKLILGLQHVLAMFGATVLVPFLTKLNPSVALLTAGVGTLIFHLCTKKIVPVFLGSSFAFIGAIALVLQEEGIAAVKGGVIAAGLIYVLMSFLVRIYGIDLGSSFAFIGAIALVLQEEGIAAVKGGVIAAGLIYVLMSFLVRIYGIEKIKSFFPPIVVGPIIVVIGLRLSPTAISMAGFSNGRFDPKSLLVAGTVVISMVVISSVGKSFLRLIPILVSVIIGYVLSIFLGMVDFTPIREASWIGFSQDAMTSLTTLPDFSLTGILGIAPYVLSIFLGMVDFTPIREASWIGFSQDAMTSLTTLPDFSLTGILGIAPIAFVVFIEHIGDITTNGAVVGKDFFKNPGISRTLLGDGLATTLLGDGLATIAAGFLGGPANTTYGENTGVLAVTKVYDPSILRIAACYAIVLSFIGKFGVILQTIPSPVMGGENTGVLAVTKVYDPSILRIAACYAIVLSFIGKFGVILQTIPSPVMGGISVILFGMIASVGMRTLIESQLDAIVLSFIGKFGVILQTIPSPVMGGISVILFGMIASVGMRTLIESQLDFSLSRNLIIASLILVFGIGIDNVVIWKTVSLSGLAIAAFVGIILNKIFPEAE